MEVIGITGGVGAGKSEILAYLEKKTNCRIIIADRVAHELERRCGACYEGIVALLGDAVLAANGEIDRAKMAAAVFADRKLLTQINGIVHPAVKEYILSEIGREKKEDRYDYLFIEAALLIEDGYAKIVDEMWYIHTDETVRRDRLKASRGYSDEKIDNIIREQLSEEDFCRHCVVVIDNSKQLSAAYEQIDKKLGEKLCQKQ